MALSPADFYAYSRATGAPVPEDPRERAEMAPEVLEFRRNQLKSPQKEESNPLLTGLGIGLALAGSVGAALGARRLMRAPKQSATAGVRQVNLAELAADEPVIRRAATSVEPQPSKTAVPSTVSLDIEDIEYESPFRKGPTYSDIYPSRYEIPRVSPEALEVRRQTAAQRLTEARQATPSAYQLELGGEIAPTLRQLRSSEFGPNITELRRQALGLFAEEAPSRPLSIAPKQLNIFSPRSYLEQTGSLAPIEDLTTKQQKSLPTVIDQKINAVESGEDQMTGRIKQQLQRNEDLDLTQIELMEEVADQNYATNLAQDQSINRVASSLPDGLPIDQAEMLANKKSVVIPETVFLKPGTGIQQQMRYAQKRATPTQVTAIGRYPAISEEVTAQRAIFPGQFGSSAGEEIIVTPALITPSSTNIQRGNVEFTVQEGRVEGQPSRYTVLPRGTKAEGLRGPNIKPIQEFSVEEATEKLAELEASKEAQIKTAMARGISEARAKRNVQITESQKQAIESLLPTYSPEDIMSRPGMSAYGDITEAERYAEELASKAGRVKALEEGGFLEEQIDPGQLRLEPRQVRPGVMVKPASRTQYRGMTGRPGVGIYGEQAPGTAGTPGFGSGAIEAKKEIKVEGEERGVTTPRAFIPGLDLPETQTPEGFVYTKEALTQPSKATGGYRRYGTQPPTLPETKQESFEISRQLRQLQQTGRPEEAQTFLDKIMKERNISALGISQPLRQQMSPRGRFGV